MRICARCRLLQEKGESCRFCGSSLRQQLSTKRSRLCGKLAGDDTIRRLSSVGFVALFSAVSLSFIGVKEWPVPWWVVGALVWVTVFFLPAVALRVIGRKVGRWFVGAFIGVVLSLVWPAAAVVVALLLILAPVIVGVPITDLFTDLPTTRLDGVNWSYSTTVETGMEGTIVGEPERMPRCWELRDRDGLVLVRGSDSSRYDLAVKDGRIELVGPLWIEDLGQVRPIGVDEAQDKLEIPHSYLFPEELYLAEHTLRADEEISVRGELRTEADWVGYRESAFRRRFVGRAGQPLLVR